MSKKLVWIYWDIHSCNFVDTNIFGHSFVSKFSQMSHSDSHMAKFLLNQNESLHSLAASHRVIQITSPVPFYVHHPTNSQQTTNRQLNKHGSTRSTFHQLHEVGYSAASTGHKVKKPSALHVNFIYSVPNMIFSLIWPFMVNKSTEKRPQGQNTNCST